MGITIDVGNLTRLVCEPYELILDRLLAEDRISESEREDFRQLVRDSQKRLEKKLRRNFPTVKRENNIWYLVHN